MDHGRKPPELEAYQVRSLSGLGLGHCQFRSLSGQVRSLTGLYRVSSGSRWPTATNLCWLDKAGLSRSQETPAHQPQLSLNWAGQVVKYYEIFSKYFTTWNIFRHELRQCVRLTRDILSQAGFDEFRGPEISPGQSVQTDEQIDAFVRWDHIYILMYSCTYVLVYSCTCQSVFSKNWMKHSHFPTVKLLKEVFMSISGVVTHPAVLLILCLYQRVINRK